MELLTNDLILRTVNEEDIDQVAKMWEWDKAPVSIDEAHRVIRRMSENHQKNKYGHIHHLCLAIFEKGTNRIIGWCGLDGQCNPGQIMIFYSIETAYQKKGYATQAAAKLLEYAFKNLGIDCIHGGCYKSNSASARVMEKAGMIKTTFDEDGDPSFRNYKGNLFWQNETPEANYYNRFALCR